MQSFKKFTILTAILFIIFNSPALTSAHAYIIKSTPFENQLFSKAPEKVTIQFDEAIQTVFHTLKVYDLNGKEVDNGDSRIDSKNSSVIECSLKPHLPEGAYRIDWKVVSSDGHPVEGVIPFGVGEAGANQKNVETKTTGYFPHIDLVIIRGIQFISDAVFSGLIFFFLFVIANQFSMPKHLEKRYKKMLCISFGFLFGSLLLNLPLQATIEANLSWGQVMKFSLLKEMLLDSFYGKLWICQFIILIILFFTSLKAIRQMGSTFTFWLISFIFCCGYLLAKSLTSHALATNYPFISIIMDFLHLLGASIWTGSIMAMLLLVPMNKMEETKKDYRQIIGSFFNWGVLIVLVLTITGLYSSFMYVTTIDSLLTTNYGRILTVKVLLFIIMLIFALINFLKGKSKKGTSWGFSLTGELTTGLIILILAVILTNLPTAASVPSPINKTISIGNNNFVTVRIDPKVVGINHYELSFKNKNGKYMDNIQQVTVTFIPPDKNLGLDKVNVPQVRVGEFTTQGMNINIPGRWKVLLHILTRDLDAKDVDFSFSVGNR